MLMLESRFNSSKEDKEYRSQVLSLNEALQYLKRKKEVSGKAKENWKIQARQNALLNKTVGAFQFSAKNKDGTEKVMTKAESKLAQEMALKIAATLDDKTKKQNKYVTYDLSITYERVFWGFFEPPTYLTSIYVRTYSPSIFCLNRG